MRKGSVLGTALPLLGRIDGGVSPKLDASNALILLRLRRKKTFTQSYEESEDLIPQILTIQMTCLIFL